MKISPGPESRPSVASELRRGRHPTPRQGRRGPSKRLQAQRHRGPSRALPRCLLRARRTPAPTATRAAPVPRHGGPRRGQRGLRGPAWVPELREPPGLCPQARSHCGSRRRHFPGRRITPERPPQHMAPGTARARGSRWPGRRVARSHAAAPSPASHAAGPGRGCWQPPCSVPPAGGAGSSAQPR